MAEEKNKEKEEKTAGKAEKPAPALKKEIENNDFIEFEYTGKEKETGAVFDTTKHEGHNHAVIVGVGKQHVIPGLDESFVGRTEGDKYKVDIQPEKVL